MNEIIKKYEDMAIAKSVWTGNSVKELITDFSLELLTEIVKIGLDNLPKKVRDSKDTEQE